MTKPVKEEKKPRRPRRSFTPQEKAGAVRMVKAGKSMSQVARELDLTLTSLQQWVKQADADAGQRTDVLTTNEREEGRYGSPRLAEEVSTKDEPVSVKRVARIRRESGLVSRAKRRFVATTDSAHGDPI